MVGRTVTVMTACLFMAGMSPAQSGSWGDVLGEVAPPPDAQTGSGEASEATPAALAGGVKETLRLAATRTIDRVGTEGGYADDPEIRIPLPRALREVRGTLKQIGMGGVADTLEARMNQAAERAAPKARDILVETAMTMDLADARAIVTGPDDAATQYFRRTAGDEVRAALRPEIERELDAAGVGELYTTMLDAYDKVPFLPAVEADIPAYTTKKAVKGMFHYMAREEARIRADPAARTSDLISTVFGG